MTITDNQFGGTQNTTTSSVGEDESMSRDYQLTLTRLFIVQPTEGRTLTRPRELFRLSGSVL